MARILIAEDHAGLQEVLLELARGLGHDALAVSDGLAAKEALDLDPYDLLITDLRMPGLDGLALLEHSRQHHPATEVILITAHGTVDAAVRAMHLGALDFVEKPFSIDTIEAKLQKALGQIKLREENRRLKRELAQRFGDLIGGSQPMRHVFELIAKVAQTATPVLVLGESGTGKELVAREIHCRSPRADDPFITVNCAALADGLLESELFGHEKGAFTGATQTKRGKFELAHRGTLFLDEVGEIPLATQVKLLRFLQEKELERVGGNKTIKVDVRVICATNRDLRHSIQTGEFREDLYYRIHVISIDLPPLRDRREDIPLLTDALLQRHTRQTGLHGTLDNESLALFHIYEWPGNVRELENVLERALVLATPDGNKPRVLTPDTLPPEIRGGEGNPADLRAYHEATGLIAQIERIEREIIRKALHDVDWNQTQAAKALRLKRSSLQYKMKKYDLAKPED